MKNKTLIISIIGAIVIVGGAWLYSKNTSAPIATNAGVYCSQDGTLSATETIQSHRSYCIKSNATTLSLQTNTPVTYSLSIIDDQGNVLKDLQTEHEKLLHLIVVRKDLNQFQHLHPDFNQATGQFTLSNLTFPTAGDYRIFADYTPIGAQIGSDGMPLNVVSHEDVTVAGSYTPQPLGSTNTTQNIDGYVVTLTSTPKTIVSGTDVLAFAITKNGKPVTDLQDYLGALGHGVILKDGTLDYIHTHALETSTATQNGTITFHVEFPSAGNYKAFVQFQDQGKVTTADFVILVAQGSGTSTQQMDMSMPGMKM
jgi:hypothetical protein